MQSDVIELRNDSRELTSPKAPEVQMTGPAKVLAQIRECGIGGQLPGIVSVLLVAALALTGCSGEERTKHEPPAVKVTAAMVDRGDIELPLILTGNLIYIAEFNFK